MQTETKQIEAAFKDYIENHLKKTQTTQGEWMDFKRQYLWQKEQDKAIIEELLGCIETINSTLKNWEVARDDGRYLNLVYYTDTFLEKGNQYIK